MTRSPFGNQSQSTNSVNKKFANSFPIGQLIILGIGITLLAAVFVQNLQPTVQIILFSQKTLPIPLSVAMLAALIGGGLLAFIFNAIADWRHNSAIRRAVASNIPTTKPQEQVKSSNSPISNPINNPPNSPKDVVQDFEEDEYEDDEYEDEDDFYEEEYEDEEEDDDPDTVPYGDRKNMKSATRSAKSNREKRDRPPLEARYITPER